MEQNKRYPIEFDKWIVEKDLLYTAKLKWQIFQDEEKDWTPFANTIDQLYQIYLKEKEDGKFNL